MAQVVVMEDEAEAADHFPSCWTWYESDGAEVRATKHAKLTDAEFKQCIAVYSLKPRSQQEDQGGAGGGVGGRG